MAGFVWSKGSMPRGMCLLVLWLHSWRRLERWTEGPALGPVHSSPHPPLHLASSHTRAPAEFPHYFLRQLSQSGNTLKCGPVHIRTPSTVLVRPETRPKGS